MKRCSAVFFPANYNVDGYLPREYNTKDDEKQLVKNCEGELWIIRKVC
jgi:hypothetical protein